MPSHPSLRALCRGLLAVVVALLLVPASGGLLAAAQAAGAAVSGVVTDSDGAKVANATVELYKVDGTTVTQVKSTQTSSDGAYSLADVPAGSYKLKYAGNGIFPGWYDTSGAAADAQADGDAFTIADGDTAKTLSNSLASRAVLGGKVTDSSGTAIGGVSITFATKSLGSDGQTKYAAPTKLTNASGTAVSTVATGADGSWTANITPGSYIVGYESTGYTNVFWNGAGKTVADRGSVTELAKANKGAASAPTSVDAALTLRTASGTVTGKVTNAAGDPISGIQVVTATRSADANGQTSCSAPADAATTQSNGTYSATVKPGTYVVGFEVGSGASLRTVYYKTATTSTSDCLQATPVKVDGGSTVSDVGAVVDASTSTISGTVVNEDGNPISGIEISAESATTDASGATTWTEGQTTRAKTNSQGTFTATVPAGRTYVVGFRSSGYQLEYYDNKPTRVGAEELTPTAAQPVKLSKTVELKAQNAVSGTVTSAGGQPLGGIEVSAVAYADGAWGTLAGSTPTTTAGDGTYLLQVPAGKKFRLKFNGGSSRETRYFPSATDPDEGTTQSVGANSTVTGRNATLPVLATLTGTLTEATGSAYANSGSVEAWREVTYTEGRQDGGVSHTEWRKVGQTAAVSQGSFTLKLPAGTYRLRASVDGDRMVGFLPGLVGLDAAPGVSLSSEQSLTGQRYGLPAQQQVIGTVTDSFGSRVGGVAVGAEHTYVANIVDGVAQMAPRATASAPQTTNSTGSYTLLVRGGTYRVFAQRDNGSRFYWPAPATTYAEADDVVVNGNDVTGIDLVTADNEVTNLTKPYISGVAKGGSTLTANTGTWSPSTVTFSYQWLQNGQDISGATGRTYGIAGGLNSSGPYAVRVTATIGGKSTTVTSKATGTAPSSIGGDPAIENRREPVISGRPAVGDTLTTDGGQWSVAGTYSYQWYAGQTAIPGATATTFQPTATQINQTISVIVKAVSGSTTITSGSAATAPVARGTIKSTGAPTITGGDPQVGKTLTATSGTWDRSGLTYRYQWLANGQEISGATSQTYTPVTGDVRKTLSVRVTATGSGYTPATASSASTAPVSVDGTDPNLLVNKSKPTITGTPKVGSTLTATTGTWTNEPTSYTYRWAAGGSEIAGATASTYTPVVADLGKTLTVTVTARKATFADASSTSDASAAVANGTFTTTTRPSISGTPVVGAQLSADRGAWSPAGDETTYAYQWIVGGAAIAGATADKYTVTAADKGKRITVQVTAKRAGFTDGVATSDATSVVTDGAPGTLVVEERPTLRGTAARGSALVVEVGSVSPEATPSIRWLRDGAPIAGATEERYVAGTADVGARLSARVTWTRDGFDDLVVTSPSSKVVTTKPTISVQRGSDLSVLTLRITLKATGATPTGKVSIKKGSQVLRSGTLRNGQVTLTAKLSKGKHRVTVSYPGSGAVSGTYRTLVVTIR